MKRTFITGVALVASLMSFNTMAQDAEAMEAAVTQRQAVFQLLAFSNGPLGQMARGADFDAEAAIKGTERLIMLADMIPETFAVDTRGSGIDTRALDSIWTSQADFAALSADLKTGAEAALAILKEQGASGVRPAIAQIGPKCGACHDRFRLD